MRKYWFLISYIAFAHFSLGQNPDIAAQRAGIRTEPKNLDARCALCETFAQYFMIDSASHCLASLRQQALPKKLEIRAMLVEASLEDLIFNDVKASSLYRKAFSEIEKARPSFSFQEEAYLQGLAFASYFGKCNFGDSLSDVFIEKCKSEGDDSLLMFTFLQKVKFLSCIDSKDSTLGDWQKKAEAIAIQHPQLSPAYYEINASNAYYDGKLPKCIEQCLLAENGYREAGQRKRLSEVYWMCASAYEEMGDFTRALEYLHKVRPVMDEVITEDLPDFYNTMGWLYYRAENIDSALIMIRRSVKYYRTYAPSNPDIAYPIGNLGLIFHEVGQSDSAKHYSRRAVKLFNELGYLVGVAEAWNNLGMIALEEENIDKAIDRFNRALALLERQSDRYEQMKANEGLYRAYAETEPKKAIAYYQRYSELKASVLSKEEAMKALQLEAEFYQERNEDHIQQLRYESQLKSLEIEQQQNRILLTSLALIITAFVAGLIFFYWLQRKKMINTLRESNEVNQRIISMISHDFRGPLNNVKLTLELLQSNDLEKGEFLILSKDLYRQSSDLSLMFDSFVGWAISQRDGYVPAQISFPWSEVVKEVVNISKPLADLKNVKIATKGHGEIALETDRMACSLILRNLLSNAIKYSQHGSVVEVEYERQGKAVQTIIRDHGIGMSQDKLQRILTTGDGSNLGTDNEYGAGLGLRMVIKYVQSIGGRLTAASKEGKGTTFVVSIPIQLNLDGSDQVEKIT